MQRYYVRMLYLDNYVKILLLVYFYPHQQNVIEVLEFGAMVYCIIL